MPRETSGLRDHYPGPPFPTGSHQVPSRLVPSRSCSLQHSATPARLCPGASVRCFRGPRETWHGLGTTREAAGRRTCASRPLTAYSGHPRANAMDARRFQACVHWGFCLRDSRGAGRAEGRALGGRWDRSGRNLGFLSRQERNSSGHLDPALSPARWVASSSL